MTWDERAVQTLLKEIEKRDRDIGRLESENAKLKEAGFLIWIPVADRLPESGKPVLVVCGEKVLRAAYAAKFSLSEEDFGIWNDGEEADYDEASGMSYWPEGWYEWNQFEETHWAIPDSDPVTKWMLLPLSEYL